MYKKMVRDGYYTVLMTYDRALRDMPSAQCGVIFAEDGTTHFVSYTTRVISITPDGWLECTGTYSQTTRKQIGRFLREYAPAITYQMAKQCFNDGMVINIHTGEVKALI